MCQTSFFLGPRNMAVNIETKPTPSSGCLLEEQEDNKQIDMLE